jgi:N-acetylglutamate synthase-like GNAT family acetyltransferase
MEDIVIKQTDANSPEYEQVWQLREEILRKPIGLSLKDEDLGDDAKDIIVIALHNNKVIGCLMLHPKDEEIIKLRQMAVYDDWQGKGVGAKLMNAAEHVAAIHGYNKIVLHARVTAKDFYSKLGYRITSDVFTEVGIDHVVMEKTLNP